MHEMPPPPVHEVNCKDTNNKDTNGRFKEKEIDKEKKVPAKFDDECEKYMREVRLRLRKNNYTPSEIMKKFLVDKILQEQLAQKIQIKYALELAFVWQELKQFIAYWTEPTKNGRMQRWELENTFELGRRLTTWFRNSEKFSKTKKSRILKV